MLRNRQGSLTATFYLHFMSCYGHMAIIWLVFYCFCPRSLKDLWYGELSAIFMMDSKDKNKRWLFLCVISLHFWRIFIIEIIKLMPLLLPMKMLALVFEAPEKIVWVQITALEEGYLFFSSGIASDVSICYAIFLLSTHWLMAFRLFISVGLCKY